MPQQDSMQRVIKAGPLSPKQDISIQIPLLKAQGSLKEKRRQKEYKSQKGWKIARKNKDPLNQREQGLYELTEIRAASTGPAQFYINWGPRAERITKYMLPSSFVL